jgi:hypothetical protein
MFCDIRIPRSPPPSKTLGTAEPRQPPWPSSLPGSDQSLLKPIRNRLASAAGGSGGSGRADVDGFEVVFHLDNQAIFDATDIEHNPVVRHAAGSDRNLLW